MVEVRFYISPTTESLTSGSMGSRKTRLDRSSLRRARIDPERRGLGSPSARQNPAAMCVSSMCPILMEKDFS
jgi:hypothetical protein